MTTETAQRILSATDKRTRLGHAVVVRLQADSPRIAELASAANEGGHYLGASFKREYTPKELGSAELIKATIRNLVDQSGEEGGTSYDRSEACAICQVGTRQLGPLKLDLRRLRLASGIAKTLSGEIIVSQAFAERIEALASPAVHFVAVEHSPDFSRDSIDLTKSDAGRRLLLRAEERGLVRHSFAFMKWLNEREQQQQMEAVYDEMTRKKQRRTASFQAPKIFQMILDTPRVEIVEPTRFADSVLSTTNSYVCPMGHVLGLNVVSEVHIKRASWDGSSVVRTEQAVGWKSGGLRAEPLILLSHSGYELFKSGVRGVNYEVVHLK